LLDWLAAEFLRQGWRIKPMLKLIMSSSVYQQRSTTTDTPAVARAMQIDPGNQFLWRQRLRRLDAEIVRDTLLAVSGKLDLTAGGPPVPIESRPDGLVAVKEKDCPTPSSKWRRSVYLLARRNYQLSLLSAFDLPTMPLNCARRTPSAVVSQSLTMLNDAFVLEQADFFAERVIREAASSVPQPQVERAFEMAFSRQPEAEELHWCVELMDRQAHRQIDSGAGSSDARQKALANLCHTLLNGSEFLYVP
jgi:hypothetical protein